MWGNAHRPATGRQTHTQIHTGTEEERDFETRKKSEPLKNSSTSPKVDTNSLLNDM